LDNQNSQDSLLVLNTTLVQNYKDSLQYVSQYLSNIDKTTSPHRLGVKILLLSAIKTNVNIFDNPKFNRFMIDDSKDTEYRLLRDSFR